MPSSLIRFPTEYPNLAGWLGLLLALPAVVSQLLRYLKSLPIGTERYRLRQVTLQLKNLEAMYENPFGLMVYLSRELVDISMETSWMCLAIAFLVLFFHVGWPFLGFYIPLYFGAGLLGRSLRLRTLLAALTPKRYAAEVARLRQEQEKLSV